ncbi:MAG: CapA family protein [Proteobacteria bacterium]|nr:CapA family protein [Pseudomonadota bacterium]
MDRWRTKDGDCTMRLFLCGDVMLGRGIDQALPHPCHPELHEAYVQSAADYVRLAEDVNGTLRLPLDLSSIWGAALDELAERRPAVRIINLETAITRSDDFASKGINYRLSPENALCLIAAGIDCCTLANNHVLDFGPEGLRDTVEALDRLGIRSAGAGNNRERARQPAFLACGLGNRVAVFSYAIGSSGVPDDWAATIDSPGVNLLPDLSESTITSVIEHIRSTAAANDIVVVSIHWGPNWGYHIPDDHRRFARALVDDGRVSIVHGHSSHHAQAIEIRRNRLILYGCGDFLNDYEGISGHEDYRSDLPLMYLPDINPATGDLASLDLVPLRVRRFRLERPSERDFDWMRSTLDRESRRFGTGVTAGASRRSLKVAPV